MLIYGLYRYLVKFLCFFIPIKSWRHRVRSALLNFHPAGYWEQYKISRAIDREWQKKLPIRLQYSGDDVDHVSTIKVLHYSTYQIQCGIATFFQDFIKGLQQNGVVQHVVVPVNYTYQKYSRNLFQYLDKFIQEAQNHHYDLISIQYEYGLFSCKTPITPKQIHKYLPDSSCFKPDTNTEIVYGLLRMDYLVGHLLQNSCNVLITWHTDFQIIFDNVVASWQQIPLLRYFADPNLHIVVLNDNMLQTLAKYQVPAENVQAILHPVPNNIFAADPHIIRDIRRRYGLETTDVILGSFGFIAPRKGNLNVLKALQYLPSNYKYLMVGGRHPNDTNDTYHNELQDFISQHHLEQRVFITGFIEEEQLANYLKIIDIATYLYDAKLKFASGSINQALLYQIPALTSVTAAFKYIEHQYHCLETIQNANDGQVVAQAIRSLWENPQKLATMRQRCREFCSQNTFKNFAGHLLRLVEDNI